METMTKKTKNRAAVALGRLGGLAKTNKPKGLAALSPEDRRRIATQGGIKRAAMKAEAAKKTKAPARKAGATGAAPGPQIEAAN
jgi:hypothetical protein